MQKPLRLFRRLVVALMCVAVHVRRRLRVGHLPACAWI